MAVKKDAGKGMTYKKAGVDIGLAERVLKERIKPACERTWTTRGEKVLVGGIGPFATPILMGPLLRRMGKLRITELDDLVLLLTTDGPGTIPILARIAKKAGYTEGFHILGYNVAAHLFADLSCGGGYPVAVLDSIASTDIDPDVYGGIVEGMADCCEEFEIPPMIVGGEMAQLPGVIVKGETNFEGFALAVAHKEKLIRPHEFIEPGQFVVSLPVDFQMLNGVSLLRRILKQERLSVTDELPDADKTFAEFMLQKQPNFARMVHAVIEAGIQICGASHITGGGLPANIARHLPPGCSVILEQKRWEVPDMFRWFMNRGNVSLEEAYKVWNMGIGFVLIFRSYKAARAAQKVINRQFRLVQKARIIGRVWRGDGEVLIMQ